MIKIFRQIRQRLFSEGLTDQNGRSNKTIRYFKYAIGEIFLVVIGILIAVQINNWNENRIANNKELILLKELLENAKADSIFLSGRLERLDGQKMVYSMILRHCEKARMDSLTNLVLSQKNTPFIMLAHQSNLIANNSNAYEKISDNIIKVAVQEYIAKYEYIKFSFQIYNEMIDKYYLPISIKYYTDAPELSSVSNAAEFAFLCNDHQNIGIVKLIRNYCINANNHTVSFLQVNQSLIQTLTAYLAENLD